MNHASVNFVNKFWVSFVIVILLFQSAAPSGWVGAKSDASVLVPQVESDAPDGLTILGSNVEAAENVPDFSAQVAAQAAAQPVATAPLRLQASVVPAIYLPGKPVLIKWVVNGLEQYPGKIIQVSIQAPAGVTPTDPVLKTTITPAGLLTIPISDANGQVQWNVGASAHFPLIFSLSLLVDGQPINPDEAQAVLIDKGKYEIGANGGSISTAGGSLSTGQGSIKISIPAGAIDQPLSVDVRDPGPQQMPPVSLTGFPVEIVAVGKSDGQNVKHFNQPISIQMPYDPAKLVNLESQNTLTIYYYDPQIADWIPMPTTVDTVNQTLTAQSDHLTVFDYKINNWQTNSLPTVDSFKVSGFTGAATYNLSMWTPPGPGGIKPDVSLNYNSQVIDESMAFSQASWVGMGWSLETGSITRNMHDTDGDLSDDTFNISVGGISGLLLPIDTNTSKKITTYNTADQSFAHIEFDDNTKIWTVLGKDGTKYVFGDPTRKDSGIARTNSKILSNKNAGCAHSDSELDLTWKWSLSTTTDTSGNTLTYHYYTEKKSDRQTNTCMNEIAVYPDTIIFPNGKYRVHFVLDGSKRMDYLIPWDNNSSRTLYGTFKLSKVVIENCTTTSPCTDSNWTPIRQYVLAYAPDSARSNVIYPNFVWSQGGKTLTLLGVQEESGNADCSIPGNCLPPVTFTYGDNVHVTSFNNGQGGSVTVQYERWQYADDLNDQLRSLFIRYGVEQCVWKDNHWDQGTGWDPLKSLDPKLVACHSGLVNGPLLQIGDGKNSATAERSIPENLAKPGARYRLSLDGTSQSGTSNVSWILHDATGAGASSSSKMTVDESPVHYTFADIPVDLPANYNPTNTKLQIYCDHCYLKKIQFAVEPSWYRVTTRTVTDAVTGKSNVYTYHYDNAAPNTALNSAAIVNARKTSQDPEHPDWSKLYTPPLREYRGNAMSEVVDPNGLANVNWYLQDDITKGRTYHTLTLQQSFYDDFDCPSTVTSCKINTAQWTPSGNTSLAIPATLGLQDANFDQQVYSTTTGANWDAGLTRNAAIGDGQMAVGHFRLSGADAEGELGLVGAGSAPQFFGLKVQSAGVTLHTTTQDEILALSGGTFKINEWYVVELFVDSANGFRLRLWQESDPSNFAEAVVNWLNTDSWKFRERVNSPTGAASTLTFDTYFEGKPFAESDTTYETVLRHKNTMVLHKSSDNTSVPFSDLAVTWSPASETSQRNYNGTAAFTGTKSMYGYDQTAPDYGYGNLLQQTDYAWTGSDWAAYRGTKTDYFPNPTTYLVSLPARQVSLDCSAGSCDFSGESGKVGEILFLYDYQPSYDSPPQTKGQLTGKRIWVGGGIYMQSSTRYDSYGNVVQQTTYKTYSTSTSDPDSSGAETAKLTYDSEGYGTYATSSQDGLGHITNTSYDYSLGLPNSVTDPNGASTKATHDKFGRILTIVAPGDSAASPTLQVAYFDKAPYHVDLTQKMKAKAFIRLSRFYDGLGQQIQTQTVGALVNGVQKNIVTNMQYDAVGRLVKQTAPRAVAYKASPGLVKQTFPANLTTTTTYDVLGRTLSVKSPNGNIVGTSYGIISSGSAQFLTTTVTDPMGQKTVSTADVWGHTVRAHAPLGQDLIYQYDVLGNLRDACSGGSQSKICDDSATQTHIEYDFAGRKTHMSDPDMGDWYYFYDGAGNMTAQVDANRKAINLYYDSLNRLKGKTYTSGVTNPGNYQPPTDTGTYSVR